MKFFSSIIVAIAMTLFMVGCPGSEKDPADTSIEDAAVPVDSSEEDEPAEPADAEDEEATDADAAGAAEVPSQSDAASEEE